MRPQPQRRALPYAEEPGLGADTADIVVVGRKTGRLHHTPIWFARRGDILHLLSFARRGGRGTDWYENLKARGSGYLETAHRCLEVDWVDVADEHAAVQVALRLFRDKYGAGSTATWYHGRKVLPVELRITGECADRPRADR